MTTYSAKVEDLNIEIHSGGWDESTGIINVTLPMTTTADRYAKLPSVIVIYDSKQ